MSRLAPLDKLRYGHLRSALCGLQSAPALGCAEDGGRDFFILLLQLTLKLIYAAPQRIILGTSFRDGFFCMKHVCMGAAENFSDFVTGEFGKFPAEINILEVCRQRRS